MPQKEITLNVLLVTEHTQTEMKVLELVLRTPFTFTIFRMSFSWRTLEKKKVRAKRMHDLA